MHILTWESTKKAAKQTPKGGQYLITGEGERRNGEGMECPMASGILIPWSNAILGKKWSQVS